MPYSYHEIKLRGLVGISASGLQPGGHEGKLTTDFRIWGEQGLDMSKFVTVAKVTDLEPGTCLSVEAEGRWVALFNVEGTIYAMDNTCPHAGGPLGEGTLTGEVVECPWHGWRYNVRTGERIESPDFSVGCYKAQVVGDRVQVAIPEE